MATRRIQRLNEQLKREIAGILRSQVRDPRVLGVTVTAVEASPDLTLARVWVSLPYDGERSRSALEGLRAAIPYVRRRLGAELKIRRVPELDFKQDLTLERAFRIEELLRGVQPSSEVPSHDEWVEGTPEREGEETGQ